MNYKIIDKNEFQVVGIKRTYNCLVGENTQGIPKFWDDVHEDGTSDRLFRLNEGAVEHSFGVCLVNEDQNGTGLMDYWIAVAHDVEAPDGFLTLEIPASKWVVFEVHGAMPHAMQNTWKEIYSEWFPSNPYKPTGGPELEVYTKGNPADQIIILKYGFL